MKVLITGASGAGKTTPKHKLRSRGYAAINIGNFCETEPVDPTRGNICRPQIVSHYKHTKAPCALRLRLT